MRGARLQVHGGRVELGLVAVVLLLLGAAGPSKPPAEAVLAELPFLESSDPYRVMIDLAPEGHRPLPLLLDTGASETVVTPRAARELGIGVRREKTSPYRRPTRLGRDLQLWIDTRSSDTASKTGKEYALLGGQFLSRYVVEIDFPTRRVRFLDPERYRVPEHTDEPRSASLPIQVVSNRPILEVGVGEVRVPAILDTGAPDTVVLSGEWATKAGVVADPERGFEVGTALGPMRLEPARVARLRLGPFELRDVPIHVAPQGWYNQGPSSDSVVGVDLLDEFLVRIDYPRHRLWLVEHWPEVEHSSPAKPEPKGGG